MFPYIGRILTESAILPLILLAPAGAAAAEPVETALSPNGKIHILQSETEDGYILYTRLSGGSVKEWTATPRKPEILWYGNIASVRIDGGNYYATDEFTDGKRRHTAYNLVALHRPDGCYLGTDADGRIAAAKLFGGKNGIRRLHLPDMARDTATPLAALDYQATRFLPDGSLKIAYTARNGKTAEKIFKRPCNF
ncbi:MAG: hypothetical protein Q3966_04375 [Neisseria sp.]|nr:hypothetical protein [Neisseria sp.]